MTLSIIESLKTPEFKDGINYTWTGYSEEGNKFSLFKFIEDNGDYYKGKYLDWVYSTGKYKFKGRSLIDWFELEDGFSYWWMMPITEKNIWKSPYITDIIRLMAIEDLIIKHLPSRIRLYSNESALNVVLKNFCRDRDIEYVWERPVQIRTQGFKNLSGLVPLPILGILSLLKYLFQRWPLNKQSKPDWIGGGKAVFFCSYFFNLDPASLQKKEYRSRYWGDLHNLLVELGMKSNWLQLYYKHEVIHNLEIALNTAGIFNENKKESHRFLDSQLSLNLVLNVLISLIRLIKTSFYLRPVKNAFKSGDSGMSFWPLIRKEWYNSLYGQIAVSNLLYYHLFKKSISDLPHQKLGLYAFEDQAWERAFIHSWKKNGHGKLIAVAHSTVRYWDFRYSSDSRMTDVECQINPIPYADFVALNGQAAINNFLSTEYAIKSIKECEALRFLNISVPETTMVQKTADHKELKVLILGDYLADVTANLMKLLLDALPLLSVSISLTLKPHPVNLVSPNDYPLLNFKVVTDGLEDILHEYDIAFAGNSTSAAVDAYLTRMKVIVCLDEYQLNMSPLHSRENVQFVSTPIQLANALSGVIEQVPSETGKDFFFLDPKLPRWRKIIMDTERSN